MYKEIEPSTDLKKGSRYFLDFSNNRCDENFKVLPDACIDLIFDLNQNKCFLSGVMSTFQKVDLKANSNLFGIRFKSENFGSLLSTPLNEVKNLRIELSELLSNFDISIVNELSNLETLENKINTLEFFITRSLNENFERRDNLIISIANRIRLLNGKVNVEEIANSHFISLRQLQRRFKHYIGLTVKEFSGIIRFKNAERNIRTNPDLRFMQIAFNMGYYDHSHMNYEFNRITGENPSYFR